MKKGAQVFADGEAIGLKLKLKDSCYYFDVTLPAVVVVAHK